MYERFMCDMHGINERYFYRHVPRLKGMVEVGE